MSTYDPGRLYLLVALVLLGIGSLVCYFTMIVQMFLHDQPVWGIACLVLICCGGPLVAFIYGWCKASEWECGLLMVAWSLVVVCAIALRIIITVMYGLSPG
jgi:hypothetical protein